MATDTTQDDALYFAECMREITTLMLKSAKEDAQKIPALCKGEEKRLRILALIRKLRSATLHQAIGQEKCTVEGVRWPSKY